MLALEPGIQINYDYFGVVFSTTWKCIDYVHVHWSFLVEIFILQKRWKVHESTRASLTPIKPHCSETTVEQLRLDPILLRSQKMRCQRCRHMRQRLRVRFWANPKSQSYKHEKVTEQSGNTTNTILLDVISESLQICDFTFFVWTC